MNDDWKFELFKAVCIDLITNRTNRPNGELFPEDVDTTQDTQYYIDKYQCANPMQGRFIITRFVVYEESLKLVLEYENMTVGTGGGASVGYDFDVSDSNNPKIEYKHIFDIFYG